MRLPVLLQEGSRRLATLSMEAGEVSLLLRGPTLRVAATLGHLSVVDDSVSAVEDPSFKQLLSVDGDDVVDFSFETFDSSDHATFPGYSSSCVLRAGSLRLKFNEGPIRDLYQFAMLFSRLQPMYSATSQAVSTAAVQRASEMQQDRMHFDVVIKTPILVFPRDGATSKDVLITRLGEIIARNVYDGGALGDNKIVAGLHGINLSSEFYHDGDAGPPTTLQIIDDVSLTFDIVQPGDIDRRTNFSDADTKVRRACPPPPPGSTIELTSARPCQMVGQLSDVRVTLTQSQYCLIMSLVQSIPRILSPLDDGFDEIDGLPTPELSSPPSEQQQHQAEIAAPATDLKPELGTVARGQDGKVVRVWQTLDFSFALSSVNLDLYDADVTDKASLKDRGISRFALVSTRVKLKMLSDGALDVEVLLRDVTMSNTRAGNSVWRDIIPPAAHSGDQM